MQPHFRAEEAAGAIDGTGKPMCAESDALGQHGRGRTQRQYESHNRFLIDIPNIALAPGAKVTSIEEVKFDTVTQGDGQNWEHCIFVVNTDDNRIFALDITGVQFGPDVPLVKDWWPYYKKLVQGIRYVKPLHSRNESMWKGDDHDDDDDDVIDDDDELDGKLRD